ncbi:hypothetical protein ACYOEI_19555, partial [Singulisphaera rosea]
AGLVAVTRQTRPSDREGSQRDMPYSVVHDLATGKTIATEEEATTFWLEDSGRIWLGADRGEWGGRVIRVDLIKGTADTIKPPPAEKPKVPPFWEGIYGFVTLRDGQVWAFGGTSHMFTNSAHITRVDGDEPRPLFHFQPHPGLENEPDPGRPRFPITHIVEEDDGPLVFSYSDVFRVDRELKAWKKVATLEIQYRWGRPDAVGAYPSVCAVHPPRRGGDPYVLATVADGYVLLDGTKATPRGLFGQLGASSVDGVENTTEGTLAFSNDNCLPTWTLDAEGWKVVSLAPPFEIDPAGDAAELEKDSEDWYETSVLIGPGGAIYTVSGTGVSSGTRATGRRVDGKSIRIGREASSLDPSSSFITADGTLWNASSDDLKTFTKGRWERVAPFQDGLLSRLTSLNTNGPPWMLLDGDYDNLWRLAHDAPGNKPQLTKVEVVEAGERLHVDDAIAWTDDSVLLATNAGLRAYSVKTRKLSRVDFPEPPQPATTLVRDGLGRLWMGCGTIWTDRKSTRGLWLGEPGAKTTVGFDRVPWVGRSEVFAIIPDPHHADGVIVALGTRGVAFVRARQSQSM